MPSTVKDLYVSWWMGGRARSAVVWKMVPLCIMWCIWRERNDRCFEDKSRSHEELLHLFFFTLFTWTEGWLAPQVISFSDFLSFFSLPPSPLCILPMYQGLLPSMLLIYSIDFSKKKSPLVVLFFHSFPSTYTTIGTNSSFAFLSFLYTSCMCGGAYTFYKAFLILPIKKTRKKAQIHLLLHSNARNAASNPPTNV
jgi:hypothetical protein